MEKSTVEFLTITLAKSTAIKIVENLLKNN